MNWLVRVLIDNFCKFFNYLFLEIKLLVINVYENRMLISFIYIYIYYMQFIWFGLVFKLSFLY